MTDPKTIEAALKIAMSRVVSKAHHHYKLRKLENLGVLTSSLQTSTAVEYMADTRTFVVNTNHRMTSMQLVDAFEVELHKIALSRESAVA